MRIYEFVVFRFWLPRRETERKARWLDKRYGIREERGRVVSNEGMYGAKETKEGMTQERREGSKK